MTAGLNNYQLEPGFLDSSGTALFTLCVRPQSETGQAVVFCPPFAEEMNKSRRMMSLAAQRLASMGKTVVIVDLHGTGESDGEFSDARWEIWKDNITAALTWLNSSRNYSVTLCGIRLGAPLALEVAAMPGHSIEKVVLWQPVISGSTFMTQFLRLKVAAQLGESSNGLTTEALREQASRGESLEIAGYDLAPELISAIDGVDMRCAQMLPTVPVYWLEVVSETRRKPGPLSQKLLSTWAENGADVKSDVVVGDSFWATVETSLVPELIEKTCRL